MSWKGLKDNLGNIGTVGTVIALFIALAILVLLLAVAAIWALNVLFGLGIPFAWDTVVAMWILILAFGARSSSKS